MAEHYLYRYQSAERANELADPKNRPFKMVNGPIVPIIPDYARDAPRFSLGRPEELPRFLRQMEDMWDGAGIVDDEEKKRLVGNYADQQSEDEWRALDTYQSGFTWLEFKAELVESYPEVAAAVRGTPSRIRQLCREWEGIGLGDLGALHAFRRAFLSEATKLLSAPAVMSNRELVELFLLTLSERMRLAVWDFLGSRANASLKQRRPEDRYDLREVCRAAVVVSENAHATFCITGVRDFPESVETRRGVVDDVPASETRSLVQRIEDLSSCQARRRDELEELSRNISARLMDVTATLVEEVVQEDSIATENVPVDYSTGSGLRTYSTMPRWGGLVKANDGGRCCYCGQVGHFVAECDDATRDVEAGLLKLDANGKLRLYNGDYIPNMPNATTIKERVQRCCEVDKALASLQIESMEESDIDDGRVRFELDGVLVEIDLSNNLEEYDERRYSQCVYEAADDSYALYVAAPEPPSPCFYECVTQDGLDPEAIDLLKVQFELEQERDQCWLDMEENEDIPVDFTTQCSSPSFFIHDDVVFRINW